MSPKEITVVKAIVRALNGNNVDMDALATSYRLPPEYASATPRQRAAMFLTQLTKEKS